MTVECPIPDNSGEPCGQSFKNFFYFGQHVAKAKAPGHGGAPPKLSNTIEEKSEEWKNQDNSREKGDSTGSDPVKVEESSNEVTSEIPDNLRELDPEDDIEYNLIQEGFQFIEDKPAKDDPEIFTEEEVLSE